MRVRQLLLVVSFVAGDETERPLFLGISPAQVPVYQANVIDSSTREFKCLNGETGESHWKARLNDNICDCQDGSDEPGTSACSGIEALRDYQRELDTGWDDIDIPYVNEFKKPFARRNDQAVMKIIAKNPSKHVPGFYCQQKGYAPLIVPAWKVNDGICDCCDGSDEWPTGSTVCPNTCKSVNVKRQRQNANIKKDLAELVRTRDTLIFEAVREYNHLEDEINDLKDRIAELKTAEAEKALKEAEEKARLEREKGAKELNEDEQQPCEAVDDSNLGGQVQGDLAKSNVSEYAKWMDQGEIDEDSPEQQDVDEPNQEEHVKLVDLDQTPDKETGFWSDMKNKLLGTGEEPNVLSRQWEAVKSKVKEGFTRAPKTDGGRPALPDSVWQLEQRLSEKEELIKNPAIRTAPELQKLPASISYTIGEKRFTFSRTSVDFSEGWSHNRLTLGSNPKLTYINENIEDSWPRPTRYFDIVGPIALHFTGGSNCTNPDPDWTRVQDGNIETRIYLVCHRDHQLVWFEEPVKCMYNGILWSPLGCVDDSHAQLELASSTQKLKQGRPSKADEL